MSEESLKVRNILVTSIMRDKYDEEVKYFYYRYGNERKFGCRVARSEAAAYATLSKTRLDEIIAVGRDTDINDKDVLDKEIIGNMKDISSNIQEMSDYGYFKYRLCEFLNGIDFETSDIYEKVPKERQNEITEAMKFVLGEDLSRGFRQVHDEFDLLAKICDKASITAKEEIDLVKNSLFVNMRKEDKISPIEENKDIQISYLPVIKTDDNYGVVTNAEKLVELLNPNDKDMLNLYIDLQSFSLADGYTLFNLMNVLDLDRNYNVNIKSVTSLSEKKDSIDERLSDVSSRYRTSQIISGIESFVNYGQTEIIENYWRKTGIKNSYIDEFLYAMSMINTGISLCNNEELIAGIKKIVEISKDEKRANSVDLSSEEALFIMQIRHAVLSDYNDLVDEDGELDLANLIKWEYRKGFYQQAMTIIESRTPEILADCGVIYYAQNEEDKQKMLVYLNDKYWRENSRFRWTFKDVTHWLVKTMPREYAMAKHQMKTPIGTLMAEVLIDSFKDDTACGIKLFTVAEDMQALKELFESYYDMGTLRNSVCHAEKKENEEDEDQDYTQANPVLKDISTGIKSFINKLEKVLEDVKGKKFESVLIDDEEKTKYINENKFYPDNDRRGRRGNNRRNRNFSGEDHNDAQNENQGDASGEGHNDAPADKNTGINAERNNDTHIDSLVHNHINSFGQKITAAFHGPRDNNNGGDKKPYNVKVERDGNAYHVYIDLPIDSDGK